MEIISIIEPCALLAELASAFLARSADRTSRSALTIAIIPWRFNARNSTDPGVVSPITVVPRHLTATKGNEGSAGEFRLADWIVPPVIIPLSLLFSPGVRGWPSRMDRTVQLQYLTSGNNRAVGANLGRATAAGALTTAASPSKHKEIVMAKGEQKSNREQKKPKKEKIKVIAAAPSQKPAGWQPSFGSDKKK
jgi:hypothetical protein